MTLLTDEQKQEIRTHFMDGQTVATLARDFHCSKMKIKGALGTLSRVSPMLSDNDQDEILRLYEEGAGIKKLASKFHCAEYRVREALGDRVRQSTRKLALTDAEKAEVAKRFDAGETVTAIARALNKDRWTIYGAIGRPRGASRQTPCTATVVIGDVTYECDVKRIDHRTVPHATSWTEVGEAQVRVQWQ